jgi:hypothetical protein
LHDAVVFLKEKNCIFPYNYFVTGGDEPLPPKQCGHVVVEANVSVELEIDVTENLE